jgi:hypothetical protein
MLTIDDLKSKWDNLTSKPGAYIRIDSSHPIDIFIGFEENELRALLIMNAKHYPEIVSSKSIKVSNYQKKDDSWVLSFTLINRNNEDVFNYFCWDLIESTRNNKNKDGDQVLNRYLKWKSLLEQGRSGILSISQQKGLIGELEYLQSAMSNNGVIDALRSWTGPDFNDRDFIFSDHWVEIKTKSLSSDTITISSIEQLDVTEEGYIVVYSIDKTSYDDERGFCLMDKVNEIRKIISSDIYALSIFEKKLLLYGYTDNNDYLTYNFRVENFKKYNVTMNFPRLRRIDVPFEILNAKYQLILSTVTDYIVDGGELNGAV